MNDYKELIDTLKRLSNKPETYQALFYTAADAIEQLVRERNFLKASLELERDMHELTKIERDEMFLECRSLLKTKLNANRNGEVCENEG